MTKYTICTLTAICLSMSLLLPSQWEKELNATAQYKIIKAAANRNQCTGDLFYILCAIRKAENGRRGSMQSRELGTSETLVHFTKQTGELPWQHVLRGQTTNDKAMGEKIILPVERDKVVKVENLFSQLNVKNVNKISRLIWNELNSGGLSMDHRYESVRRKGTQNKEQYLYFSSTNVVDPMKHVDTTLTKAFCTGTSGTLLPTSSALTLYASPLNSSNQLLMKLKSVSSCMLVATESTVIQTMLNHPFNCQRSLLLSEYENFVKFTALYEIGGREFGIMHPKALNTNLDTQAGWAAATVKKCHTRWQKAGSRGSFLKFLGNRYCPPDAHALNKHWHRNVKHWYMKYRSNPNLTKEIL